MMDQIEYLYFIPLLIYGIALSDIFGEFKHLLKAKTHYWPYIILIFILSESAVFNVYQLYNVHVNLTTSSYLQFWLFLIPPIVFLLAVNAIVNKDENADKEQLKIHFDKQLVVTFSLIIIYLFLHYMPIMHIPGSDKYNLRIVFSVLCLMVILIRKEWFFYLFSFLWALSVIYKFTILPH